MTRIDVSLTHEACRGAALALVSLALAAAGCGDARSASGPETVRVTKRTLRSQIQATGVVRAMTGAEVKVGARVSGQVRRLFANVGDKLEKGAPIAQLDDRDLRARVARARADLAATKAQLGLVRRGARAEEVAEGEAAVRQSEAELVLTVAQEQRVQTLSEKNLVSHDDLDKAKRDLAVARAKAEATRSKLDLLHNRYLPEELALAEAKVQQAEAALDEAEANLAYATIQAPIGGVIAQVTTQEGETVSAGLNAPTFVTLIDLDRLEVAAYVDEVDVGRVRVGQKATFSVDSFPEVEFTGAVTAVYPRAVIQSNVVNYITTIAIENSQGRLKPDMTANATISLDERTGVLALPEKALAREGGKTVAYAVDGTQQQARPVRVGMRGGGFAEIISGLAEGEQVALPEAPSKRGAEK
jgi:multidrug efflux pump subunit AcrA (membrane-fusion protein)